MVIVEQEIVGSSGFIEGFVECYLNRLLSKESGLSAKRAILSDLLEVMREGMNLSMSVR